MTRPIAVEPVDPASVGMSADRLAFAAGLVDRQVTEGRSPCVVAAVARRGQMVFTHAAGEARPGGPPATLDSVLPIASQTKPMTAAVVMCLVERGLVGLNEPAALTLPELAAANGDVQVHHLLTHTSGWNDDDHVAAREAKLDDAIASIPAGADPLSHILIWPGWGVPRRFGPGEMMQYCNFNYDLLSEIVRRVTGDTLDAAMRTFLFEPLGMDSTALIVGDDLAGRVIERPAGVPYGTDDPDAAMSFDDPLMAASDSGSGGVHSTAPDLVRFGQMILDDGRVGGTRIISPGAVELMTTNRIPGIAAHALGRNRREASWGYGFGVVGWEPYPRFGAGTSHPAAIRHGGAGVTYLWTDPVTGVVAAYIEVVTEIDDAGVPVSWVGHRFEEIVNAAVLD